jgi:cyclomaltodextrin glucanotransferase
MSKRFFYFLFITVLFSFTGVKAADDIPVMDNWDFRNETIYFVMTDRFVDGDKNNNNIYGDEYNFGNLKYYQGGDFKGLIDNLDYIKDMGFTAIWITPPVMQPPGRYINSSGSYDAAGYHGYWGWDFSRVDPHLESPGATYQDLINAAHSKGLKIVQDIVLNHGHGGDVNPQVKWYDKKGQVFGLGKMFDYFDDKENWFHHSGPVIADLLDFNEDNPLVVRWLSDIYKDYQDMGVDAFRLDTVVWMKNDFWKTFTEEMHKNKKDFFMFGEVWTNSDYDMISGYTKMTDGEVMNSGMSVLDMPSSSMGTWGQLEQVFKGGDYTKVDEILKNDYKYKDATYLVTFLDNHDKPRFNGNPPDGDPATTDEYIDALNFYFTARGIPCIYYGTEVQMVGGNDPDNRRYLGLDGIKLAKSNPVYIQIKKLNALRRSNLALQKGKQTNIYSSKDQYAFKRIYNDNVVYVFLNKDDNTANIKVSGIDMGDYADLLTGEKFKIQSDKEFNIDVSYHSLRVIAKK